MKKGLILLLSLFSVAALYADVTEVSAERAAGKIKKDPEIVVVDLRTPKEFKKGHIKGAINIDLRGGSFAKTLSQLDRKKTYVMHCRSGSRSAASIPVWKRLGFQSVLHLASGTLGWKKAGHELVLPASQGTQK